MIKNKTGNILQCTEDIICHQVNNFGYMSGGLARQLANQYPRLEEKYSEFCSRWKNDYEELKGTTYFINVNKKKIIANIFSQKLNFDTDYQIMRKCFEEIKYKARCYKKRIAIPYRNTDAE